MSKKSCISVPYFNGKPSKLYKDLLGKSRLSRQLTNLVYAIYTSGTFAADMDATYTREKSGEHSANDVLARLNFASWQSELASFREEEFQYGFVDANDKRIDFTNPKEALDKANDFNEHHKGLTATVVKHGNSYNVIAAEKTSRTVTYPIGVRQKLQIWDIYKQFFNALGIDIENVPQGAEEIFNAFNDGLIHQLRSLQQSNILVYNKANALALLFLNSNVPQVDRFIRERGSIERAAQMVEDMAIGNTSSYTPHQQRLMLTALVEAKKFRGMDLDALKDQVKQASQLILNTSPEEEWRNTLHKLNKQYKIDINEIHRIDTKISKLSEATADAAITLKRQINQLDKIKGDINEEKRKSLILDQLLRELASNRYCSGMINFLKEANADIKTIDNLLNSIPQTGTELEKAFETAKIIQTIQNIKAQYFTIVSAMADESVTIDESISQVEIDSIRSTAKDLVDYLKAKEKVLNTLTEKTMLSMLMQIIGDKTPDGQAVINAIRTASVDSSNMDRFLYSIGRASNPILASMGKIIRNAQDSRSDKMNEISRRIRLATDKLYKAGFDTTFMYEDEGHIISDIDWNEYKQDRKMYIRDLYRQGLRGIDLKEKILEWEEKNTEERVVDITNGRTERVPSVLYSKPFPPLEPAQREYYDTMMQLKGEIGSLLPAYAQKQYLPPQIRRNTLDALGNAKDAHDVEKALYNKVKNLWTIREDDTNYNMNGIIDGDEYQMTEGDYDNTPLKQIPIFYINKVEQGELLLNFSSGLAALAGTAINYSAMDDVVDVVEFIGNFVKDQAATNSTKQADMVDNAFVKVFKDLFKKGTNTNTIAMVDGWINQHIYGQKRNPNESKIIGKLFDKLIAYTSFKGLSTNVLGAASNYFVGEFQMLIEAGAGEFYGFKNYLWAHKKLFGSSGVAGELAELLTNNMSHKGVLFRELFDPMQENFKDKSHTKYYKSMFRQLVAHDCSFIGYASGEYLIHYVNMYAILDNIKVMHNGKEINLYDAFEIVDADTGNPRLALKDGLTYKGILLEGQAKKDFIEKVKAKITYANQSTHGAMNEEDKGLIHQYWLGRGLMNFRQWMVEHYSRRFRGRHFDAILGEDREGYWVSFYKGLMNDTTKEALQENRFGEAIGMLMKDLYTFTLRSSTQWNNLDEMQKHNIKRVRTEMLMFFALLGASFALGEPDDHKREVWRRWWIYHTRRLIMETKAALPFAPAAPKTILNILQSPMSAIDTADNFLYMFYGIEDITDTLKSGPNKGENKYIRNVKKKVLPGYKHYWQMRDFGESDATFKIFDTTSTRY